MKPEKDIEKRVRTKLNDLESIENLDSKDKKEDTKTKTVLKGVNDLSLGISMVVAVIIGFGLGYWLYKITDMYWLIWVGLGYGIAAAALNVIKAYKRLHKELDSIKDNEKYNYKNYKQ